MHFELCCISNLLVTDIKGRFYKTFITLIFIEIMMAQNGTDVVYLRRGIALTM